MKNIVSDRIQFCVGDNTEFDIELRGNLIVVDGFSGQGKTYFFNSLRNAKYSEYDANVNGVDLDKIVFINILTKGLVNLLSFIKEEQGKLIIIDNADIVLTREIAEYIGWDNRNQYIIFSRANWPFHISPNYFTKMVKFNGKHVLKYPYNNRGWN